MTKLILKSMNINVKNDDVSPPPDGAENIFDTSLAVLNSHENLFVWITNYVVLESKVQRAVGIKVCLF